MMWSRNETSIQFARNAQGHVTYLPWGLLGSGYIVPASSMRGIQLLNGLVIIASVGITMLLTALDLPPSVLLAVVASIVGPYAVATSIFASRWEVSGPLSTFRGRADAFAAQHGRRAVSLFCLLSLALGTLGLMGGARDGFGPALLLVMSFSAFATAVFARVWWLTRATASAQQGRR